MQGRDSIGRFGKGLMYRDIGNFARRATDFYGINKFLFEAIVISFSFLQRQWPIYISYIDIYDRVN